MFDNNLLSQHIISTIKKSNVAGLSIAVVEDKEIVYSQLFGSQNTRSRPELQASTQFQAASLSKPVFAYLVLKLCEKQIIDLDLPLSHYWSKSYSPNKLTLEITARQVLTHSTGFPNWRSEDEVELETPPGESFGYSGEGYEYLQKVVEYLVGQPLHDYARANLFEPLGMPHTTFAWGLDDKGDFLLDDNKDVLPPTGKLFSHSAFSLLTTAPDYAQFLIAMLNPEENHPFKLSSSSVKAMLTPQISVGKHKSIQWGLGWGIQKTEMGEGFWHWGGAQNNYLNYSFALNDARKAVVIMTNDASGIDICESIAQAAIGNQVRHPAFDWIRPINEWRSRGL